MLIFESTKNTRPILEDSVKYIRSDAPTRVSEQERCWLLANNVTTVIDLRTDAERAAKPCPLSADARFSYQCGPLKGGDTVPKAARDVSRSYIAMVDADFDRLITLLLDARVGVLYFCTAGKDRTGVVSAVLLYKLGLPTEYIVRDYMRSRENLAPMLAAYAAQHPDVDINVITPNEGYIREFLAWYIANNG